MKVIDQIGGGFGALRWERLDGRGSPCWREPWPPGTPILQIAVPTMPPCSPKYSLPIRSALGQISARLVNRDPVLVQDDGYAVVHLWEHFRLEVLDGVIHALRHAFQTQGSRARGSNRTSSGRRHRSERDRLATRQRRICADRRDRCVPARRASATLARRLRNRQPH